MTDIEDLWDYGLYDGDDWPYEREEDEEQPIPTREIDEANVILVNCLRRVPIAELQEASRLTAAGYDYLAVQRILRLLPPGTALEQLVEAARILLGESDDRNHTNHTNPK